MSTFLQIQIEFSETYKFFEMNEKGKGKVQPRRDHEGPQGEHRYSSTISLTSVLDGGGWSTPLPGHFTPGTHCVGGWVGHRTGLDRCANL